MPVGGRHPVVAFLSCIVLAISVSSASAQMVGDEPTCRLTRLPSDPLAAASANASLMSDLGNLRLGLAFQLIASLAVYRWMDPATGRLDAPEFHSALIARTSAARSASWRKRS